MKHDLILEGAILATGLVLFAVAVGLLAAWVGWILAPVLR